MKSSRGQAVSIISEAGVGKSRLLYEFRKMIANENVTLAGQKFGRYFEVSVGKHSRIEGNVAINIPTGI